MAVKPLVEAFFAWAKQHLNDVLPKSETAKANNLKPYNYFELLLKEIPKHLEDTKLDFLSDLLPWSEKLPVECKKQNNN